MGVQFKFKLFSEENEVRRELISTSISDDVQYYIHHVGR